MLTGETVDTAKKGEELAAKYPDVGMTGAMIEEAITRAAGMMGMIRGGTVPPAAPQPPQPAIVAGGAPGAGLNGTPTPSRPIPSVATGPAARLQAAPPPSRANGRHFDPFGDDSGPLIFGPAKAPPRTYGEKARAAAPASRASPAGKPEPETGGHFASGAVAALRRAFFRG